jgi:phage terminase large subunit-like protein
MTTSLDEMLGLLMTGLKNPSPNHLQYQPHEKQVIFHKSQTHGRQFLGGNRSGKTVAGINEDIMWALGKHLYTDLPKPPIFGRIVTVDFKNGANDIIIPQLKQWIPPSELKEGSWDASYNGKLNVLTLRNGSQIEIMSHEQSVEKFAGVPRHWTHFDEEPPKDIFKECLARLVDYNGRWWMTMTPVDGMTWTFDDIFEKRNTPLITVVEVDIEDNPYLSKEGREALMAGYDEDEVKIRGRGRYIAISGLVFKWYDPELHVVAAGVPDSKNWEHYYSLDAGYNNPTAVLWHAVNRRSGAVVTYHEHYRREWTVEQHAKYLLEEERKFRENYEIIPFLRIADPAIKQRQQVTGLSIQIEYANHGINFATGAKRDVNAGLDKMNNYLRLGKWFITEDCPNLQKEMRKYRRAQYATSKLREKNNPQEQPQKKDDHAIDSTRYFFSFMPELNPHEPTPTAIVRPNLLDAPTFRVGPEHWVDQNLISLPKPQIISDEFIGEW